MMNAGNVLVSPTLLALMPPRHKSHGIYGTRYGKPFDFILNIVAKTHFCRYYARGSTIFMVPMLMAMQWKTGLSTEESTLRLPWLVSNSSLSKFDLCL